MKILLVDNSEFERQIIVTLLESKYRASIVEVNTAEAAIETIKSDQSFDCVLSRYELKRGTGGDVFKYILDHQLQVPFILCTSKPINEYREFIGQDIVGTIDQADLVRTLSRLMDPFIQSLRFQSEFVSHCKIRLSVLRKINFVNCDLYLGLSKTKFVKVKNKGDPLDSTLLAKYEGKNIDSFFILREEASQFIDYLLQNLVGAESISSVVEDPEVLTKAVEKIGDELIKHNVLELTESLKKLNEQESAVEVMLKVAPDMQQQVRVALKALGLTCEVETLIKSSIHFTVRTMNQSPNLAKLLALAMKNGGDYYSSHSMLLSYISCAIAERMKWNSDFTRYKLTLASFIHDIWLDEKLARCKSLADTWAPGNNFTPEERDLFASHPEKAANVVREMNELPPDIDRIVLQHHERPNGTGFPLKLQHTQLMPLSCVFIVAHDLVSFIFEHNCDQPWTLNEFLNKYASEYSNGYFKRIRSFLEKEGL